LPPSGSAGARIEPLWTRTCSLERWVASKTEPTIAATTDAATTARRIRRYADMRAGARPEVTPCIINRNALRFHRIRRIPGKTLGSFRDRCATITTVGTRVLIVDDHQPFRAVARELLERAGYVVSGEAADAAEALDAVAADAPDAVLLDVQLPDRDGFAVATELAAGDGPAVVLISSRQADDYGRRVEACGARGFISKSKLSAAAFAALLE
jgi:CheY-like chemotaxis protein